MKYSIAVLFTIIAWFSTCVLPLQFNPPAPKVISDKLNISLPEFIIKCQAHKGVAAELIKSNNLAAKVASALADQLVEEARKSSNIDESIWDKLTQDNCLGDVVLRVVSEDDVDEINDCFEEAEKLQGANKTDFTNALLDAYCAEVKRLAKEKYAANKN